MYIYICIIINKSKHNINLFFGGNLPQDLILCLIFRTIFMHRAAPDVQKFILWTFKNVNILSWLCITIKNAFHLIILQTLYGCSENIEKMSN